MCGMGFWAVVLIDCSYTGCIDAIQPHLPQLVPYLVNMLSDTKVGFIRNVIAFTVHSFHDIAFGPVHNVLDSWAIRQLVYSTSLRRTSKSVLHSYTRGCKFQIFGVYELF